MILVHLLRWSDSAGAAHQSESAGSSLGRWLEVRFSGFVTVWLVASLVGYTIYFGVGGFLHVSLCQRLAWTGICSVQISGQKNFPQMS